ncbi:tyrosine/phenylalanine carboxypeptidase domain-containing protein [Pacificimonas flava]|uniref:DUF1704 domain-containing protein n=1 Tax=Pacificimonas flava TaxID=1234595 RepID=M2T722_9SPHN|nr:tyrosine/phenylalanine carboxypeptidase domain-containing protein [Pacificimonas flava]EMD82324.1 hypothetical protein C725_2362 [Pacificimonas flava]MBB5280769.1 uncharacterized protein (TIGR02421 family) [Pacificimonas flava]
MAARGNADPAEKAPGLCSAAHRVDDTLSEMDGRIDWLSRLTPVNLDDVFAGFKVSGFRDMPALRYDAGLDDLEGMRRELFALPVREIENELVEALLMEKQRELDRQLELVRLRGGKGFIQASLDLFGDVSTRLLDEAEEIIESVPAQEPEPRDADCEAFCELAREELAWYRDRIPELAAEVVVDPHPGTHVFVSQGNLHVACDYRVPVSHMIPLMGHEIGTHVVTRYNGRQQPLRTLEVGLADYDALQEGLGVLSEYLSGYLPPMRLRTLAARVIAAHMALQEKSPAEIFAAMYDHCHMGEELSFSTTIRALRGGGMTKDALYLSGLSDLVRYLNHDGDFEALFIGKFALKHIHTLETLREQGIVMPPALLPRYLEDPAARDRLDHVRTISVTELYQKAPA